eukprot:COSAG06_NODE_26055_length_622_cov_29.980880_1_plen_52_part_10
MMIILPRQARDKHIRKESTQKVVGCFLRGKSLSVGELEELVDLFERSHARLK